MLIVSDPCLSFYHIHNAYLGQNKLVYVYHNAKIYRYTLTQLKKTIFEIICIRFYRLDGFSIFPLKIFVIFHGDIKGTSLSL